MPTPFPDPPAIPERLKLQFVTDTDELPRYVRPATTVSTSVRLHVNNPWLHKPTSFPQPFHPIPAFSSPSSASPTLSVKDADFNPSGKFAEPPIIVPSAPPSPVVTPTGLDAANDPFLVHFVTNPTPTRTATNLTLTINLSVPEISDPTSEPVPAAPHSPSLPTVSPTGSSPSTPKGKFRLIQVETQIHGN